MSMTTTTAPKCPFNVPVAAMTNEESRDWCLRESPRKSRNTADGMLIVDGLCEDEAAFIAHAINQHATLTAEVERLSNALHAIADGAQQPGHVAYLSKDAMARMAAAALRGGA